MPELTIALTGRAMLRVDEGKFDEAWQGLLACHRLGRLVARGGTLIEGLIGIALDRVACDADLAYLERSHLTSRQLRDRLKDLQELLALPPMADKIDLTERLMYLDVLQLIPRGGVSALTDGPYQGLGKKPNAEERKILDKIDWEPALRDSNRWYDRMVATARLKDRVSREQGFDAIEADLKALQKKVGTPADLAKLVLEERRPEKLVGKKIGDLLINLMMPALRKVQPAYDRNEQTERNLHVAFALAGYHRDHGRYPTQLADLAPKYLATVPDDLFSGKALVYRLTEKGYLLYSVGVNGKDEEGRSYGDQPSGDDLAVRMPLPELKRQQ